MTTKKQEKIDKYIKKHSKPECEKCNLKFETTKEYANHLEKFCENTPYYTLDKIKERERELKAGKFGLENNPFYEGLEFNDLKEYIKTC